MLNRHEELKRKDVGGGGEGGFYSSSTKRADANPV